MKDDGHVRFYSLNEFISLGKKFGFSLESNYYSKIRFPRKNAENYSKLLETTNQEILDIYEIEIRNHEIFITEDVLNISFIKN